MAQVGTEVSEVVQGDDMRDVFFLGTESHYWAHLIPIWEAYEQKFGPVELYGHMEGWKRQAPRRGNRLAVVASYKDYLSVRGAHPVVYLEHGIGQTYLDFTSPSYAGNPGKEHVTLFLCPNELCAEKNRATYPRAQVEVVGSPYLDSFKGNLRVGSYPIISFHWSIPGNRVPPEMTSAFPHYEYRISAIPDIHGHYHPRARDELVPFYQEHSIPVIDDFVDVIRHASVFICDNSSAIYYAAACGIPTVILNAPWYRRDVHHGIRFWDILPGIVIDDPADLPEASEMARNRVLSDSMADQRLLEPLFPQVDNSAQLAASLIYEHALR